MANAELVNGGAGIWTFIFYTKCTSSGNKLAGQKCQGNPSSCPGEVPEPSEQATAAPTEGPVTSVATGPPSHTPTPASHQAQAYVARDSEDRPKQSTLPLLGFCLMPPRGEGQEAGVWSHSSSRFLSSGRGGC